jgi:hypothetical protein
MALQEEFCDLVNKLVLQKQGELSRRQLEKERKIAEQSASRGWDVPTGHDHAEFDDLQVEAVRQLQYVVWSALEEALAAFDPPFSADLAPKLHAIAESHFPEYLCEPHDVLKSMGHERPFAEEAMEQLRSELEMARNSSLNAVNTKIDLYVAKKWSGSSQAAQPAAQPPSPVAAIEEEVLGYYAERDRLVHQKLEKASSLAQSDDPEDFSLLLTSIRRAVKAVADFHLPPSKEQVVCSDGQTRELGEEQYLNRLQEFCAKQLPSDSASRLLKAELELLAVFVRRLNDVASKGVHSEVTKPEAVQGLKGLYMFLSNLIARLD